MDMMRRLFDLYMRQRRRRFDRALRNPAATQTARLREILAPNRDTAFGRQHGFATLADADAYRRAVPIRQYAEFTPYVERTKQGERNVLTVGAPEMFAITSGTTAEPKFCPVTPAFVREYHGIHLLWLHQLMRDRKPTVVERLLTVVSPAVDGYTAGGIPYGSTSGRQLCDQSWILRRRHPVPYRALCIKDYDSRYHAILVFALTRGITVVTSVNPSTLVLLGQLMNAHAEELLDDLEHGSLRHAPALTEEERGWMRPHLRPAPKRAKLLRERRRADGALLPRNAWPELTAINCWQGGSAPFYLDQIPAIWGDAPQRCLGLRASEGNFTVPMTDHSPAGALGVSGHFLEFLPAEADPQPDAPTLLAHELEEGKRYRLVITTGGGFYRYDLADIVEVTGFRHATPEVAFLHKAGGVLSITGEKVTENQVVTIMAGLAREAPPLDGFTVTVEMNHPPRYVLALESAQNRADSAWAAMLHRFERELSAANGEYRQKRASGRIAAPLLLRLAPGSYRRYRTALTAEGRPDGQIKPPHLVRPAGAGDVPVKGCPFFDRVEVTQRIELLPTENPA